MTGNTAALSACALALLGSAPADAAAGACKPPALTRVAAPAEIRTYFRERQKIVLSFLGYSGAEYKDPKAMMQRAGEILREFDPAKTIVNIGATREGAGAIYELAKERGFETSGIVSTQAQLTKTPLSPCVDLVFFVKDETWGGVLKGTSTLSPTSTAMVENSDQMVAIGGGEVSRVEALAAERAGKRVRFFPADMNHKIAVEGPPAFRIQPGERAADSRTADSGQRTAKD
jgi:hypothetical protein